LGVRDVIQRLKVRRKIVNTGRTKTKLCRKVSKTLKSRKI
jgi:hypothetical protein